MLLTNFIVCVILTLRLMMNEGAGASLPASLTARLKFKAGRDEEKSNDD